MLIEQHLRQLAGKHQETRFVRLHYEDAQMEPAGVPALIAYGAGEKFAGLVPLINELPDDADLDADTIESVLKRYVVLRRGRWAYANQGYADVKFCVEQPYYIVLCTLLTGVASITCLFRMSRSDTLRVHVRSTASRSTTRIRPCNVNPPVACQVSTCWTSTAGYVRPFLASFDAAESGQRTRRAV
jgi:hypothetical protein